MLTPNRALVGSALVTVLALGASGAAAQTPPACKEMRKINVGVSVAPPNVVHTTPYVARELGLFKKYCVDANIMQFEGGSSATSMAAVAQGTAIANVTDVAVGRGIKAKQVWGFAPRLPQSYVVAPGITKPEDLKGKRLSASGGGVGSFNWRMGRYFLVKGGLKVEDANFISQGLAGRLPGLVTNQIDGVALHPEDVYLAKKQRPDVNILGVLADEMPDIMFNAYGASEAFIAKNRDTLIDTIAAMIEANRAMYETPEKVLPIIVKETGKDKDAVEFAMKDLTSHCVWSINTGLDPKRSAATIEESVRNGDIEAGKNLTHEQLVDLSIADAAVKKAGGVKTIKGCSN